MGIKNIILLIGLLLVWTACKKKKTEEAPAPKQYSTWIINGTDTFTTNEVDSSINCNPDYSYCTADFGSNDLVNRFGFDFFLPYFPSSGAWPLGDSTASNQQNSNYVYSGIRYNSQFYIETILGKDTLYASSTNGKISYKLNPTWYKNYNNHDDSILVQGTFNLP